MMPFSHEKLAATLLHQQRGSCHSPPKKGGDANGVIHMYQPSCINNEKLHYEDPAFAADYEKKMFKNKPGKSILSVMTSGYYACYQSPQRRNPIVSCDFCPHYPLAYFCTGDMKGNIGS